MSENKEFEEWYKRKLSDIRRIMSLGGAMKEDTLKVFVRINKIRDKSYEAGQQSERDKHRWIPVTEIQPTEKDGKECSLYVGKYDEYHKNCISVLASDGIRVSQEYFDFDKKEFCTRDELIIKWQPLPEA